MNIHWLAFTVHASEKEAFVLYKEIFEEIFGELLPRPSGGKGYKQVMFSLFEFKLYLEPGAHNQKHFHIEIPGKACEFIPATKYQALVNYLEKNHSDKYKFKRIDIAYDYVGFTPQQAYEEINNNRIRSLAKRETLRENTSPLAKKDNGELGTMTVYLGSNQSERMIRIYDKRGFTRLELQTRNNRAHKIGVDIFNCQDFEKWYSKGIAHLRDYIDFQTDWWEEFNQSVGRANLSVTDARQQALMDLIYWVETQVSPSLSVLADAFGELFISRLISYGRKRRGNRFDHLLDMD